jgi:beta-galactosidase GanA
LHRSLAKWALKLTDLTPVFETTGDVEVTERWQGNKRLLFILNHTSTTQTVTLDRRYVNLLNDQIYDSAIVIPAKD